MVIMHGEGGEGGENGQGGEGRVVKVVRVESEGVESMAHHRTSMA